ncbi:hypothetical protein D5018_07060 [Parashewanella curva]|uniref:Excisionase n=1 Tax=Parashewanella curva TaxID=2338552 RepID=A0A3L8PZ25_9GAMM|nr:hypothetical protein [Parashewanella curva]RLV60410.1 hypothetical protein D5018_07060 [Parashewanella curva]
MNHKLMKASHWAKREFDQGSMPCAKTLRNWIKSGIVEGRFIDGKPYVFANERAGIDARVADGVKALLRA